MAWPETSPELAMRVIQGSRDLGKMPGEVRGGTASRMGNSPRLAVVEEVPATSGGGWQGLGSPAKMDQAI